MSDQKLETFPDITPSSIKKSSFRTIERGDISSEDELQELIYLLFNQPECETYYFSEYRTAMDLLLETALVRGDILSHEMVMFYYKHPDYDHNYVLIEAHREV